jgi:hypothetical protein
LRGIYRKFYYLITQRKSYDEWLLDCYKVSRFTNGGASLEYLKNLPLDQLNNEVATTNKAAEQEKMLIEAERASNGV